MKIKIEHVENNATGESNYSIELTEKGGIKIAEINENGCDYHDFVLIYYKAEAENIPLLKQLHEKYKESEKTVCFIGCVSGESDFREDFSEFYEYFDLNIKLLPEQKFESIVLSAYSCRSGLTHGDPQDWLNLKDSASFDFMEENGTSVAETAELLYSKLKKHFSEHQDCRKIKNGIISVISNTENILISDIEPVRKLTDFFENGGQLLTNLSVDCDEIKPGNIKITLIKSLN